MSFQKNFQVRVMTATQITPGIKHFVLEAVEGAPLAHFSGGSHIVVVIRKGDQIFKNPYSLVNDGHQNQQYQIAVRRQETSRGGSAFMHDVLKVGDLLEISPPANLFMLDRFARKHLLLAGGVGITPVSSMIFDLARSRADYELHYSVRGMVNAAFWDRLSRQTGSRGHLHVDGASLDISGLLQQQPVGTHVYVCGPPGMVEAVKRATASLGWPESRVHYEEFNHASGGDPFDVTLAKSGRDIRVAHNQSLLEALENAGLEPPFMCRGGVCGACETGVIEGQVEHRDDYLTVQEKAGMRKMMLCVSRAACDRLVIDL